MVTNYAYSLSPFNNLSCQFSLTFCFLKLLFALSSFELTLGFGLFSTVQFSRFNVFFRFRLSPSTFNILSQLFSFVNNFFIFFKSFFQSRFSNSLFLLCCSSFFPANKIVLYSFCKKCQHFLQTFFQKFAIFLFLNFSFLIYRYFKTFNFYCLNAFSAYF